MNTTDTSKTVDPSAASPEPAEAGTAQPTESTDTTAPKPAEDAAVLKTIQETSGETHEAIMDIGIWALDSEKFFEEFKKLLCRIEEEKDPRTVTESLIPELEEAVIYAMEEYVTLEAFQYGILGFFHNDEKKMRQVITAINKIGINLCIQEAQKEILPEASSAIITEPHLYDRFVEKLLEAGTCHWVGRNRNEKLEEGKATTIQKEAEENCNAIQSLDSAMRQAFRKDSLHAIAVLRMAEIVFPDYIHLMQRIYTNVIMGFY
jgi:hypothetical protein